MGRSEKKRENGVGENQRSPCCNSRGSCLVRRCSSVCRILLPPPSPSGLRLQKKGKLKSFYTTPSEASFRTKPRRNILFQPPVQYALYVSLVGLFPSSAGISVSTL